MSFSDRCTWVLATSQVTGRPCALAARTMATPVARRQARNVDAGAGFARQLQDGGQRDGFGQCRNAGQAEARGHFAIVRDAVARQDTSCGRSHTLKSKVAAYCMARSSTWVSVSGASAWVKAMQPASVSSAISVSLLPSSFCVSAPSG